MLTDLVFMELQLCLPALGLPALVPQSSLGSCFSKSCQHADPAPQPAPRRSLSLTPCRVESAVLKSWLTGPSPSCMCYWATGSVPGAAGSSQAMVPFSMPLPVGALLPLLAMPSPAPSPGELTLQDSASAGLFSPTPARQSGPSLPGCPVTATLPSCSFLPLESLLWSLPICHHGYLRLHSQPPDQHRQQ